MPFRVWRPPHPKVFNRQSQIAVSFSPRVQYAMVLAGCALIIFQCGCVGEEENAALVPPEGRGNSANEIAGLPLSASDARQDSVAGAVGVEHSDGERTSEASVSEKPPGSDNSTHAMPPEPREGSAIPAHPSRQSQDVSQTLDLRELYLTLPTPRYSGSTPLLASLDGLRAAMRQREFLAARQHLNTALQLRTSVPEQTELKRIAWVHALWSEAWNHTSAELRVLKIGDRISTWGEPAIVQAKSSDRLHLRIGGLSRSFALGLRDMEIRLASALVERRSIRTGMDLDIHVAALWVLDGQGSLEKARDACINAVRRGLYIDPLTAELQAREKREAPDSLQTQP